MENRIFMAPTGVRSDAARGDDTSLPSCVHTHRRRRCWRVQHPRGETGAPATVTSVLAVASERYDDQRCVELQGVDVDQFDLDLHRSASVVPGSQRHGIIHPGQPQGLPLRDAGTARLAHMRVGQPQGLPLRDAWGAHARWPRRLRYVTNVDQARLAVGMLSNSLSISATSRTSSVTSGASRFRDRRLDTSRWAGTSPSSSEKSPMDGTP